MRTYSGEILAIDFGINETTDKMIQPNDTERDTPTERGTKVECLNRFHLISLQR